MGLAYWIFFMLLPSINYVLFPTVQILTSAELRQHVFSLGVGEVSLKCCTCTCMNRDSFVKEASVALAVVEAIEMTARPLQPRPAVV